MTAVRDNELSEAYHDARDCAERALDPIGRSAFAIWGLKHSEGADHLAWWPGTLVGRWGPIGREIAGNETWRVQLASAGFAYLANTLGAGFDGGWRYFQWGEPERAAPDDIKRAVERIEAGIGEVAAGVKLILDAANRPGASPEYRDAVRGLGRRMHQTLQLAWRPRQLESQPEGDASDVVMFLHRWWNHLFDGLGGYDLKDVPFEPVAAVPRRLTFKELAERVPAAGTGSRTAHIDDPWRMLVGCCLAKLAGECGHGTAIGREGAPLSPFHQFVAGVQGHLAGIVVVSARQEVRRRHEVEPAAVQDAKSENWAEDSIKWARLTTAAGHTSVRKALAKPIQCSDGLERDMDALAAEEAARANAAANIDVPPRTEEIETALKPSG